MSASGVEVEFAQPVEEGDTHVAGVRHEKVPLVGCRVPAGYNLGRPDRGQPRADDPPEFSNAIVGKDETRPVDPVGQGHACSPTATLRAAAKLSRALTLASPSAMALTRTMVSSPVMPPV